MRPIRRRTVHLDNDPLDLISTGPLRVTRMLVDPPHVLANFRLDGFEQKVVDRV